MARVETVEPRKSSWMEQKATKVTKKEVVPMGGAGSIKTKLTVCFSVSFVSFCEIEQPFSGLMFCGNAAQMV